MLKIVVENCSTNFTCWNFYYNSLLQFSHVFGISSRNSHLSIRRIFLRIPPVSWFFKNENCSTIFTQIPHFLANSPRIVVFWPENCSTNFWSPTDPGGWNLYYKFQDHFLPIRPMLWLFAQKTVVQIPGPRWIPKVGICTTDSMTIFCQSPL